MDLARGYCVDIRCANFNIDTELNIPCLLQATSTRQTNRVRFMDWYIWSAFESSFYTIVSTS